MSLNWTNITDFGQLPAAANTASGGYFWTAMLYMLWFILILVFIAYGWEMALMVSSFLALILGLILVYADLVAWHYVVTFIGILLFMFLYVQYSSSRR